MRDFLKMTIVLFLACGLAAGSLAVVNNITKKPIAEHVQKQKDMALEAVAGGAEEFVVVTPDKVWSIKRNGCNDGHVFMTQTPGYSGPISLAIGTDGTGAVTGIQVMGQSETPGLGAKIVQQDFTDQFKGKNIAQLFLKKDDPRGQIDAITGATISSRAVTNAIRSTVESFSQEPSGVDK